MTPQEFLAAIRDGRASAYVAAIQERRAARRDLARITGRTVLFLAFAFLVFVRGESGWLFGLALLLALFIR